MASKRLIRIEEGQPEAPAPPPPPEETWKQWFMEYYIRYWYWLFFIFLDIMTLLWLWSYPQYQVLAVVAFVVMLAAEYFAYMKLWGPGGRYGPEDDD
jgi:NADH:ubiquinone oxidoreductase subunit 3 (subunit A)